MDAMTIQRQQTIADIEKMAGSVKKMSAKQIGEMDEQLVQQQLDLETTQERRKNFLEGRGMTLRNDFVDRRAHVLGHEPVLRRGDTKSERRRDKKVTKLFEGSYKNIDREQQQERRTYARNEETAFIRTRSFASPGHYGNMVDAKRLMTQNPENYAANRQAVDAAYRDLYAACEVHGTYMMKMRSYDSLQQELEAQVRSGEISREDYESMSQEAHRRAEIEGQRQELVERRIQTLTKCLEMFLGGADMEESVKEAAQAYMPAVYTQSQKEEMRRHLDYEETKKAKGWEGLRPLLRESYKRYYRSSDEKDYVEWEERLKNDVVEAYLGENYTQGIRYRQDDFMHLYREGDEEWNQKLADAIVERSNVIGSMSERSINEPFIFDVYTRFTQSGIDVKQFSTMSDEELKRSMTEYEDFGILCGLAVQQGRIRYSESSMPSQSDPTYCIEDSYVYSSYDLNRLFREMELLSCYTRKARVLWQIEEYKTGVLQRYGSPSPNIDEDRTMQSLRGDLGACDEDIYLLEVYLGFRERVNYFDRWKTL